WRLFSSPAAAPTAISTLSLHDALPICERGDEMPGAAARLRRHPQLVHREAVALRGAADEALVEGHVGAQPRDLLVALGQRALQLDRKSTRLNSSHVKISYAVFCLKKKK